MDVGFKSNRPVRYRLNDDDSTSTAGIAGDFFFPTLPTSFIESKQPTVKLPEALVSRCKMAGA
jgi:hypothetical protein